MLLQFVIQDCCTGNQHAVCVSYSHINPLQSKLCNISRYLPECCIVAFVVEDKLVPICVPCEYIYCVMGPKKQLQYQRKCVYLVLLSVPVK